MLPPSYLDQMPDAFVQLWQRVEDEILQDVARRIGKMDAVTPTANWQLWRYQQTEAVRGEAAGEVHRQERNGHPQAAFAGRHRSHGAGGRHLLPLRHGADAL